MAKWNHLTILLSTFMMVILVRSNAHKSSTVGQTRKTRSAFDNISNEVTGTETSCSIGSLKVQVNTKKNFNGAVYTIGYPNKCRAPGLGNTTTVLKMSSQKCGIKVIEDKKGHHKYKVLIYIQYDKWVQQIIDEKVVVQCVIDAPTNPSPYREVQASVQMNTADGTSSEEKPNNIISSLIVTPTNKNDYVTIASKLRELVNNRGNSMNKKMKTSNLITKTPNDSLTSENPLKILLTSQSRGKSFKSLPVNSNVDLVTIDSFIKKPNEQFSSYFPQNQNKEDWKPVDGNDNQLEGLRGSNGREPISAWMDFIEGTELYGDPLSSYVEVGDDITMVIKVRQDLGLDTRIISCLAHDGSGDNSQDLIDENGCAIDDAIMPPLRVKRTKTSNVKISYATFKAFKFPDRDNLHMKCTILICLGSCSLPTCGRTVANGSIGRKGRNMELTGTGTIVEIDEDELQPVNKKISRGNSRTTGGRIVDRVEVFNSVEVRATGIERSTDSKQLVKNSNGEIDFFNDDDSMFCVTPYKMILAFGILLTIMASSILFALYYCVKGKLHNENNSRPPSIYGIHQRHPTQHLTPQHYQHIDRRGSPIASPYYRFHH